MADDIIAFQAGREDAISGKPRGGRRSADYLEGYDMVMSEGEKREMAKKLLAIAVAKLHDELGHRIMHGSPDVAYKGLTSEGIGG